MKDLTKGKPSTLILAFALPIFFANLLQLTYSLVDTRIVGTFLGEDALAAVGATSTLSNLIIGFLQGLSGGFAIITAQKFGAKDYKDVKKSFAMSLLIGTGIALFFTIFGLLFLQPILKMLNVPVNLLETAKSYIFIIIAGLVVTYLYDACAAALRSLGDSVTPLVILAISVILNIIGDLFFVVILKSGVKGAAIATVLDTLTARRKLRMEFVKQKKKKAYLQSRQEKLKSSQEDIDGTYEEKLTVFTNLQSEYQEYENEASLPTSEDLETQALNLAMDTIGELSRNIYLQKGRKIRIRASRILRELTNGKFMEFYGDEGQRIELSLEDGTVGVEELERGEIEVLYFSIRMAASELLTDEKILPVVLDDVFHGERKESLMAISRWLKKQPRQIILLTKNENVKSIFSGKQ